MQIYNQFFFYKKNETKCSEASQSAPALPHSAQPPDLDLEPHRALQRPPLMCNNVKAISITPMTCTYADGEKLMY